MLLPVIMAGGLAAACGRYLEPITPSNSWLLRQS